MPPQRIHLDLRGLHWDIWKRWIDHWLTSLWCIAGLSYLIYANKSENLWFRTYNWYCCDRLLKTKRQDQFVILPAAFFPSATQFSAIPYKLHLREKLLRHSKMNSIEYIKSLQPFHLFQMEHDMLHHPLLLQRENAFGCSCQEESTSLCIILRQIQGTGIWLLFQACSGKQHSPYLTKHIYIWTIEGTIRIKRWSVQSLLFRSQIKDTEGL